MDEIEAIRLADLEGEYQEQVAKKMNVSRQTIGRILSSAHRKTAEALVQGKAIRLEGGQIQFSDGVLCRCGGDEAEKSERCSAVESVQYQVLSTNENRVAKIAISAMESNLDSEVDIRFGRSKYFIIYNLEKNSFDVIDNRDPDNRGGRGTRASKMIIEARVEAVITGQAGAKSVQMLAVAGTKIFSVEGGTVREAIQQYRIGEVQDEYGRNDEPLTKELK